MTTPPADTSAVARFQGLLANPLFNVGTGLLVSGLSGPESLGQGLGRGLQFGLQQQGQVAQNQFIRERIRNAAANREANAKRQEAVGLLREKLEKNEPLTQGETLGLLTTIAPGAVTQGLLGSLIPQPTQPTSFQRDFQFLEGRGLSQDEILKTLKKGGVNVNVGNIDKPLSVSDLSKVRLPDNSIPPLGTTPRQAAQAGATVLTNDQQKALDSADKFKGVLDRLEQLALGEGGVFSNIEPGLGNRFEAGIDLFVSSLTRENPNVAEFDSLASGTVAPIIRQLGDSGALSDGDVKRALGLLPEIRGNFLLPDTREDARRKLETLRGILEKGEKKLRGGLQNRRTDRAPKTQRRIDFNDLPG